MPWAAKGQIVGDAGVSVTLLPSVANAAALPATGNNPGDARMTEDTGHLHFWNGTAWTDAGQFQGPAGAAGQTTVAATLPIVVTGDPTAGYTASFKLSTVSGQALLSAADGLYLGLAASNAGLQVVGEGRLGVLLDPATDNVLTVAAAGLKATGATVFEQATEPADPKPGDIWVVTNGG